MTPEIETTYRAITSTQAQVEHLRAMLYRILAAMPYTLRVEEVRGFYLHDTHHILTIEQLQNLLGMNALNFRRLTTKWEQPAQQPAPNQDGYSTALLDTFMSQNRAATFDRILAVIEIQRKRAITATERSLFSAAFDRLLEGRALRVVSTTPGGTSLYTLAQ